MSNKRTIDQFIPTVPKGLYRKTHMKSLERSIKKPPGIGGGGKEGPYGRKHFADYLNIIKRIESHHTYQVIRAFWVALAQMAGVYDQV